MGLLNDFGIWIKKKLGQVYVQVVIMKEYSASYRVLSIREVHIENKKFTQDKSDYILDLTHATLRKDGEANLYYLEGKPEPLMFKKIFNDNQKRTGSMLHSIEKSSAVDRLINRAKDKYFTIIIIALIVVIAVVAIYSIWQINELQKQLVELAKQIPKPIVVNP